ncbi:MAG: CatA-like O-acetyltransferase [Chloroflexota bacterium]
MHLIDLDAWPRRRHYELFRRFDYPHFNMTAPVDVTRFYAAVKARRASYTIAAIFAVSTAANRLVEFRWRMRGDQVVEHDTVDPAPTLLGDDDLFSYYSVPYINDYTQFAGRAQAAIERTRRQPSLADEPGRDDYLFLSAIPWVSFTGISHPIHLNPDDSTPRISWGKLTGSAGALSMPVSVQVNHALVDGVHVGRFYTLLQTLLDAPDWLDAHPA